MTALERAIDAAGGVPQLAESIGISRQALYEWTRIPAERVVAVERATGIPREELRPDLYAKPKRNGR